MRTPLVVLFIQCIALSMASVLAPGHTAKLNGHQFQIISSLQAPATGGEARTKHYFKAMSFSNKKYYTIKQVHLPSHPRTFEEIRIQSTLSKAATVVRLLFSTRIADYMYIVFEYGEDNLEQYMNRHPAKSQLVVAGVWIHVLDCIKDLHQASVVHTYLHPKKFILVNGKWKITNFQSAFVVGPSDPNVRIKNYAMTISIDFAAPEMLIPNDQGFFKLGKGTDIWSLGVLLYRLLFSTYPFEQYKALQQDLACIAYGICEPSYQFEKLHYQEYRYVATIQTCLNRSIFNRPIIESLNYIEMEWLKSTQHANQFQESPSGQSCSSTFQSQLGSAPPSLSLSDALLRVGTRREETPDSIEGRRDMRLDDSLGSVQESIQPLTSRRDSARKESLVSNEISHATNGDPLYYDFLQEAFVDVDRHIEEIFRL